MDETIGDIRALRQKYEDVQEELRSERTQGERTGFKFLELLEKFEEVENEKELLKQEVEKLNQENDDLKTMHKVLQEELSQTKAEAFRYSGTMDSVQEEFTSQNDIL